MKVKFILYRFIVIILPLLGWGLSPVPATAQNTDDSAWRNMDYIKHSSPWLQSGNAAGLRYLPVSSVSNATVSFAKSDGKFINYYQSDNSSSYTLKTESYYRMNKRTVFQGAVSYRNFNGKNMQGSAWINPYQSPLGFDEYADTTAGTKKLEQYHLLGAVGIDVNSRWALGAKINYTAANYAKVKDMRHFNKLLGLDFNLGANYKISNRDEAGITLQYGRRVESLKFSISGNTDKQYITLIDFGSFYGIAELHSNYGFTADENPMVNISKTISAIYTHRFLNNITWLNEFSYTGRNGYFGKKGSASIVYTEHNGNAYAYKGIISKKKKQSLHSLTVEAAYSHLDNNQNVYRRETSSGGNSIIVYYGSNTVLNQNIIQGKIEYASFLHTHNNNPHWTIKSGGNFYRKLQTVTIYPYYRKQEINHYDVHAFVQKNIPSGKKMFALSLDVLYGSGFGTAKDDGTFNVSGTTQTVPASRSRYLYQEYEYFTKPRLQGILGLQYAYSVTPASNVYLQLNYNYTQAFNVEYIGKQKSLLSFTAGYNF